MTDTIVDLFTRSVLIAAGFFLAVAFYESLCARDVLVSRVMRATHRRTSRRGPVAVAYGLTVLVAIPMLVVLWTIVLELALLVVGSVDRLGNIALVAASVVAATRILAYARERTSHELAKAIPLALAFVLLTGGSISLESNLRALIADPDRSDLTDGMIVFLVGLEIGLRLLTDGSHAAIASIRRRRGMKADEGVWRTIWSFVRHPAGS